MPRFRYCPGYPDGARLAEEACSFCGARPALDGAWLDFDEDYDEPPPVCADCLLAGKAHVVVPGWVQKALAQSVAAQHLDWNAEARDAYVAERTHELAHTPPVPWIQNNEWPICGDDYAQYAGELTRERLEAQAGSMEGAKRLLRDIMVRERPLWPVDEHVEQYWEYLGGFMAIFRFRCQGGSEVDVLQMM